MYTRASVLQLGLWHLFMKQLETVASMQQILGGANRIFIWIIRLT